MKLRHTKDCANVLGHPVCKFLSRSSVGVAQRPGMRSGHSTTYNVAVCRSIFI